MADALANSQSADPQFADQLLPLVYSELRKLAANRLAHEKPGQTLAPTALVHEAYLRLLQDGSPAKWNSRGHFFAAAGEAMRRILVEQARSKQRIKHGGEVSRQDLSESSLVADDRVDELLGIHEALDQLERHDAQAAVLVKLRFFSGFEHQEAAEMLGLTRREADRLWLLARTWLHRALSERT